MIPQWWWSSLEEVRQWTSVCLVHHQQPPFEHLQSQKNGLMSSGGVNQVEMVPRFRFLGTYINKHLTLKAKSTWKTELWCPSTCGVKPRHLSVVFQLHCGRKEAVPYGHKDCPDCLTAIFLLWRTSTGPTTSGALPSWTSPVWTPSISRCLSGNKVKN